MSTRLNSNNNSNNKTQMLTCGPILCRIEHEKIHAKHKGHEAMHMEMVLILFATLAVAQVVLVRWKKQHFRSYQVSSITGGSRGRG